MSFKCKLEPSKISGLLSSGYERCRFYYSENHSIGCHIQLADGILNELIPLTIVSLTGVVSVLHAFDVKGLFSIASFTSVSNPLKSGRDPVLSGPESPASCMSNRFLIVISTQEARRVI